jgi:uncharacterized protein (TIGR02246 family)
MNALLPICMACCLVAQSPTETVEQTGRREVQQPNSDEAIHEQLQNLRDALFEAYESHDVDAMMQFIHPNAVITWQNGQRNRGPDGFRRFYNEMMQGEGKIVQSITSKVTINDLSVLHGDDTAVAFGELDDKFVLVGGKKFELHSRFTATLVKVDDRWLIAAFHVSANVFDNPLLNAMRRLSIYIAIAAAIIGVVIGAVVGRRLLRRKG